MFITNPPVFLVCAIFASHLCRPEGVEQPADPAVNSVQSGTGWQLCGCRILYLRHNCRRKLSGWHFLLLVISRHNNKLNRLQISHTYAVT